VPNVNIVNNSDLLKSKPYGTFKPQVTETPVDDQQAKKTSVSDDTPLKPSSEEETAKDLTSADKTANLDDDIVDSKTQKSQTSGPDASSNT